MTRAYHGSQQTLDRLSVKQLAEARAPLQGYGWGLYFFDDRDTASVLCRKGAFHADIFLDGKLVPEESPISRSARMLIFKTGRLSIEALAKDLDEKGRGISSDPKVARSNSFQWLNRKAAEEVRAAHAVTASDQPGALYDVTLPDESELFDWDKPLAEQPEAIKARLGLTDEARAFFDWYSASLEEAGLGDEFRWGNLLRDQRRAQVDRYERETGLTAPRSITILQPEKVSGKDFYLTLALNEDASTGCEDAYEDASNYLKSLGIPGLRYLDESSPFREAEATGIGYVIWDDSVIQIERIERPEVALQEGLPSMPDDGATEPNSPSRPVSGPE